MKMKILLVGDSNFRNSYGKERYELNTKMEVYYQQAGTTAAAVAILGDKKNEYIDSFVLCSFYNELTFLTKMITDGHVRDTEARTMVKTQIEAVDDFARKNQENFFTIMKPIRRKHPIWLAEKCSEYIKMFDDEFAEKIRADNVFMLDGPGLCLNVSSPQSYG